jgi:predicted glycoside hydrolase/deacetylase ChbG (UPF0249 family)
MHRSCVVMIVLLSTWLSLQAQSPILPNNEKGILIRCDDLGMCHAVNMAALEVLKTGLPVSFSLMVACPAYQEAVEILKAYPHVSVGVHLTLNAEWINYRWGPVAGRQAVPSLVDSAGFFFPSRPALFGNNPRLSEIETELRAQIEKALRSGIKIDYLDHHMSAAVNTLETRQLVESLAKEYGLAVSWYFEEIEASGIYRANPANKLDTVLARVSGASPGRITLFVFHVGLQGSEMDTLVDFHVTAPRDMSMHREAELRVLLSSDLHSALRRSDARLLTYRDLLNSLGTSKMKRPIPQD